MTEDIQADYPVKVAEYLESRLHGDYARTTYVALLHYYGRYVSVVSTATDNRNPEAIKEGYAAVQEFVSRARKGLREEDLTLSLKELPRNGSEQHVQFRCKEDPSFYGILWWLPEAPKEVRDLQKDVQALMERTQEDRPKIYGKFLVNLIEDSFGRVMRIPHEL